MVCFEILLMSYNIALHTLTYVWLQMVAVAEFRLDADISYRLTPLHVFRTGIKFNYLI